VFPPHVKTLASDARVVNIYCPVTHVPPRTAGGAFGCSWAQSCRHSPATGNSIRTEKGKGIAKEAQKEASILHELPQAYPFSPRSSKNCVNRPTAHRNADTGKCSVAIRTGSLRPGVPSRRPEPPRFSGCNCWMLDPYYNKISPTFQSNRYEFATKWPAHMPQIRGDG
jgi:hypothetical protein